MSLEIYSFRYKIPKNLTLVISIQEKSVKCTKIVSLSWNLMIVWQQMVLFGVNIEISLEIWFLQSNIFSCLVLYVLFKRFPYKVLHFWIVKFMLTAWHLHRVLHETVAIAVVEVASRINVEWIFARFLRFSSHSSPVWGKTTAQRHGGKCAKYRYAYPFDKVVALSTPITTVNFTTRVRISRSTDRLTAWNAWSDGENMNSNGSWGKGNGNWSAKVCQRFCNKLPALPSIQWRRNQYSTAC